MTDNPMPRVIGVAANHAATAVALPNGTVETIPARSSDGDLHLGRLVARLTTLARGADLAAVAEASTHARNAGVLRTATGIARAALIDAQVRAVLIPDPLLRRYATGSGTASDAQLRSTAGNHTALASLTGAVAWWARAALLDHLGHPPADIPPTRRDTLDRIAWPPDLGAIE